jgi:heme exporter protein A
VNAAKRLLSLDELSCIRGNRLLFQNLSCGLDPGDVLHLCGPNGSGKTSLLRIIAGALPAAAGAVRWDGEYILKNGAETHARRFAFLPPDDRSLKLLETCAENLAFWARLSSGATDISGIHAALERLGLGGESATPVRRLSAGQRRRLSLARLLLTPRRLWLLDEPFNGLDAGAAGLFAAALEEHVGAGGLVVAASHQGFAPPRGGALRQVDLGKLGDVRTELAA